MSLLHRLLFLALFGLMLGGIAGCNTMEGAGEDIESAGEALEGEAEEHND